MSPFSTELIRIFHLLLRDSFCSPYLSLLFGFVTPCLHPTMFVCFSYLPQENLYGFEKNYLQKHSQLPVPMFSISIS